MKIGTNLENLAHIQLPQFAAKDLAQESNQFTPGIAVDSAQVSTAGGKAVQSASEEAVRLDKVATIQNALAAGTYSVPASAVASKVVDAMLSSKQ